MIECNADYFETPGTGVVWSELRKVRKMSIESVLGMLNNLSGTS